MPDFDVFSLLEIRKRKRRPATIFFVKKPKIFENVKSERAAANFQKSGTPRASSIISKNSQIKGKKTCLLDQSLQLT